MFFKDWKEKRNLYRGPSIDASYQVYLAKRFQKKIKMWKVNRQRTPSDGKKLTLPLAGWAKKTIQWLFMYCFDSIYFQVSKNYFPPHFPIGSYIQLIFSLGSIKFLAWEIIFCHFPISMLKLCFPIAAFLDFWLTHFVKDHPRYIQAKPALKWFIGFKLEN